MKQHAGGRKSHSIVQDDGIVAYNIIETWWIMDLFSFLFEYDNYDELFIFCKYLFNLFDLII